MNLRIILTAALGALLISSCTSTVSSRIEKNQTIFNSLSDQQKALVQHGRIEEGMSKEAVWLSWGRADRIALGSHEGRTFERWSYTGYDPVFGTTIGFGAGGACWGAGAFRDPFYFYEPTLNYVPYEARRVEFTAGRVSAWAISR